MIKVSVVNDMAVFTLFPSCTRIKSSARRIRMRTAKIETLVKGADLINGAENKTPKTPITTAQRIKAIRGK